VIAQALVLFVGLQHLAFAALEIFFWHKPLGRKIFRTDPEFALRSRALPANQGLYNVFLAAGLLLSFFLKTGAAETFQLFFLSCVVAAGVFGAFTVSSRILYLQALPAALGLALLLLV
jgi:putative membrane protein